MYTHTTFIQHSLGSSSHNNQRKRNKGIQIGKEVKLSLCADDRILQDGYIYIILYVTRILENSKDDTRKPLTGNVCFSTSWTLACQAPLSMEFSSLEYCSG